jgi:hypothetical protein
VSSTDTITWYETRAVSVKADLVWLDASIELIENLAVPLLLFSEFFSQEDRHKTESRIKNNSIDLIKVLILLRF